MQNYRRPLLLMTRNCLLLLLLLLLQLRCSLHNLKT
jgi:hypothetical protein